MFDQTFINAHAETGRPWTVAISLGLQTTLVAVALIAPLVRIASLGVPPATSISLPLKMVDLKLVPEPRAAATRTAPRRAFRLPQLQGPTAVPRLIDLSPDAPEIENAIMTTGPSDVLSGRLSPDPLPAKTPAVSAPAPSSPAPVRVGGGVQSAKLIFGPKPAYPPLARAARMQGTVKIQALIARDGSIGNLQVLSGPPLLIGVAMEAVKEWRYQPTLLNGEPVEVITEIAVTFLLSQ